MLPRVGEQLPQGFNLVDEIIPGFHLVEDERDSRYDDDGKADFAWIVDANRVVIGEVLFRGYGFGHSIRESALIGVGCWVRGQILKDTLAEFLTLKAATVLEQPGIATGGASENTYRKHVEVGLFSHGPKRHSRNTKRIAGATR